MTSSTAQHPPRPVVPPMQQKPKPDPRKPYIFTDWAMI